MCVSVLVCGELTSSTFLSFWFHYPPFLPFACPPPICSGSLFVLVVCFSLYSLGKHAPFSWVRFCHWPSNSLKHMLKHKHLKQAHTHDLPRQLYKGIMINIFILTTDLMATPMWTESALCSQLASGILKTSVHHTVALVNMHISTDVIPI